jgi:hypothetical protein
MKSPLRLFRPGDQGDLTGHTLTGLYVEDSHLHLRLIDRVATIDLETGGVTLNRRRVKGSVNSPWVVLPGWLRITDAALRPGVFCLDVSGTLYSSQILTRKDRDRWHLAFKGGFTAPPMNPRNL